ncbi:D-alanyl-D-alanine carboxypeptidase [Candidatus Arthromitus sp. SFB-mouse-Japan]|uniref:D-alanyl-D-alanine carboxypeptidase family protein n=1 Tax=unclassified Candidatus Neoarthromitus TaxID=2638829 RepID=UPI00021B7FAB|nr:MULTISPECIES: D-alanyl-D-alanine carboxypeptidase family protein [unclassified Candidatus Arthromitus]EIA21744.1 D-alanyl-D-alanine carboxypeptidase [Candidatus Arthromitus sp. SFB-1]EIA22057.1 D-alanyl-D-alanine carboxypeptidase [Candidatus Arthromitus sp. SFB-2]EIA26811.1 D-alanyl-D-alanine carboxypeptidase [Candidatus Arthromitus sp. SFB-5]EIA26997.1 D-alanyl-D-alanine carboxypeptidase [Candidatus Arthromitus sp. SFB-co]EIA30189.1 D-alanyl-D-alanine carboxypeptidase [Candidatus Arthromit
MKKFSKLLVGILCVIFSVSTVHIEVNSASVKKQKPYDLNAHAAIVIDAKTHRVLFDKNGRNILPMASTTKILTSLVAIKYGDLDQKIKISPNAASIRGSKVGYKKDEEISLRELIYGLMFKSGNDAAIAIAEGIAGSIEGFCDLMNEYAKEIGILDSHFESPHGLDSQNHYSTAYDLAMLTSKTKQIDFFNELSKTKEYTDTGFSRSYQNINKILYMVPQATGTKTGYTGQAGKCLVSSFNMGNNNEIVVVVLNCTPRWKSSEWLYNYAKDNYEYQKLFSSNDLIINESLENGIKIEGILKDDVIVPVTKGMEVKSVITLNENIKHSKDDDEINEFENLGTLKIFENEEQIYICPIINKNYKSE